MTGTFQSASDTQRPQPSRARLMLRDGRILDANIYATEGVSMPQLLASRDRFVNLTDVHWHGGAESPTRHIALHVDRILWIGSLEGDIPLAPGIQPFNPRPVTVRLEDGRTLHAQLHLAYEHRISDYLDNTGDFVVLHEVQTSDVPAVLDAVALNQDAIISVQDAAED